MANPATRAYDNHARRPSASPSIPPAVGLRVGLTVATVKLVPGLSYPTLTDGVVALRPWGIDDVDDQLAAFADPVFVRFSDWAPDTRDQLLERLQEVELARENSLGIHLAITHPATPSHALGEVALSGIDDTNQRASVGYWLSPAARGRGLASRAVRLISRWAFDELGLLRLELTCGPDNPGSQGVAVRCGFRLEGLLRSHMAFKGGRRDSLVYGLLPDELLS